MRKGILSVANKSLYVRSSYQVNQTPQFKMLSNDQCEEAYLSALEVLERTGADIFSADIRNMLLEAGCWLDGNRVRFPGRVVEKAVSTAPSRVAVCNRKGERALFLEAQNTYAGPSVGNGLVLDVFSGERRERQAADDQQAAVICDALPNIAFAAGIGAAAFADIVSHTVKPVVLKVSSVEEGEKIFRLAATVAGGEQAARQKPFAILQVDSASPLYHAGTTADLAAFAGRNNQPLAYVVQATAGSQLPKTMAGALAMALADGLLGLTINQLAGSGAPFIIGGMLTAPDRKNGAITAAGPEANLLSSAFVDVCRWLRLPNMIGSGASDAKAIDPQSSQEAAFALLAGGLSGANLVSGCNMMESGRTGSLDQLVMSDEILGMVKRIQRGIVVDDDTMAVDVIDAVGPGGHFLGEEHTMLNFRSETWRPTLMNRKRYDDWMAGGGKTLGQRVNEKAQGILQKHQPEPLNADVLDKIRKILA